MYFPCLRGLSPRLHVLCPGRRTCIRSCISPGVTGASEASQVPLRVGMGKGTVLGGSWVVISGVVSRVTIPTIPEPISRVRITLLVRLKTTHEPTSS